MGNYNEIGFSTRWIKQTFHGCVFPMPALGPQASIAALGSSQCLRSNRPDYHSSFSGSFQHDLGARFSLRLFTSSIFHTVWKINRLPNAVVSTLQKKLPGAHLIKDMHQHWTLMIFCTAIFTESCYWLVNMSGSINYDVLLRNTLRWGSDPAKKLRFYLEIVSATNKRFGHHEAIVGMAGDIAAKMHLLWPHEEQNA